MKFTIFNLENQKSENIHCKSIQKIIVNNINLIDLEKKHSRIIEKTK